MAAAPPRVADAAAENPVSLKVMRLCKPIFGFSLPVPFSSLQGDAPKEHNGSTDMLQQADDGDLSPDLEHIGCAITGALMLPQSFGDIFLGETFSCYVSLTNISSAELCQMGLKVEVQTQLQRETLSDSSLPENGSVARFAPQETLDRIIRYELKDLGIHILICSALYSDSLGERKYFRKFFKFQVQNPLSMKSKTHSLHAKNEILVETQLQNATQRPLFLESVAFLPTEHFEAEPLTDFDAAAVEPAPIGRGPDARARSVEAAAKAARCPPVGLPNFGHMAYLKPGDTQQHMYRLKGKQSPAQLRLVGALGRMEVVWKAQMGESGHLQSNTVQRKLPHTTARALEVHVVSAPQRVAVETPFEIVCSVCNGSAKDRRVGLRFDARLERTNGIVCDGISGRDLGVLKAHSMKQATLRLVALEPGIHKLVGIELVDSISNEVFEVGELTDVLAV